MHETLEGIEDNMTNGLIRLPEDLADSLQVPELIVIDNLDFIARASIVDRLSQGVLFCKWFLKLSTFRIQVKYRCELLLVSRYGHPTFSEVLLIAQNSFTN